MDKTASFVDAGAHPTEAVLKSAQELGLSSGEAELVARTYNTGRAAVQRDDGGDTLGKMADFDLADSEVVRERLKTTAKAAAAAALPIADCYSRPPAELIEHYAAEKRADVQIPELRRADPLPKYTGDNFERSASDARQLQRKIASADEIVDTLTRGLDRALDTLVGQFACVGAPSLMQMRKTAGAKGDLNVTAVIDEVARRRPILEKRAAGSPVLTREDQKAYAELEACVELAQGLKTAAAQASRITHGARQQIVSAMEPYGKDDGPFADLNRSAPGHFKRAQFGPTQALLNGVMGAFGGRSTATLMNNSGGNGPDSRAVAGYLHALDDPNHERRLQAIKARAHVEGLMSQDPVLSGYDPDQVVGAYNAIVGAAPRTADQPLYLQTMMRRYLAQGGMLDPDDVRSNVLGTDQALMARQNVPQPQQIQEPPRIPQAPSSLDSAFDAIRPHISGAREAFFGL